MMLILRSCSCYWNHSFSLCNLGFILACMYLDLEQHLVSSFQHLNSFELQVYTTYDPQKIVCQQKSISLHLFLKFSQEVMDLHFQVQDCHMHFLNLFRVLLFTFCPCQLQKWTLFISLLIHRKNFWMGYTPREPGFNLIKVWTKIFCSHLLLISVKREGPFIR